MGEGSIRRINGNEKNAIMYLKKKLWTLAFVLALLKTRLDHFHGGTEMGHWEVRKGIPVILHHQ